MLMSPTIATAPQRVPQRHRGDPGVRGPDPERRHRHLRSVDTSINPATRGRPRVHIVLGVGVGALFAVLFAVAVLQTVLVQGQIRLDGLQAEVAEAQVQVQNLRAEVAQLESPGRVLDEAGVRGMVPSIGVQSVVPGAVTGPPTP
jgi:outer membrane murein-binding lipoprotein Lpp